MMVTGKAGSESDVFLALTTAKSGKVKGESTAAGHEDEINVVAWNWGVSQPTDSATGLAAGRRAYKNLVVFKTVDAASTKLMNAVSNNETVTEAVLTMRKAGGDPMSYFTMTLRNARVAALDIEIGSDGRPVERIAFAFTKIDIAYTPQTPDGIGAGASSFSDEWATPAT